VESIALNSFHFDAIALRDPDSEQEGNMKSGKANFLSVQQFAEVLGITVSCVRRWLLIRKISHIKLGRLVRIPEAEVERLVNEGLRSAIGQCRRESQNEDCK
jgi:excisionase family DNA binding protein